MLCRTWRVKHHFITMPRGYRRMDTPSKKPGLPKRAWKQSAFVCREGGEFRQIAGFTFVHASDSAP